MKTEIRLLWFTVFFLMILLCLVIIGTGYLVNKAGKQIREINSEVVRLSSRINGNATAIDYALNLCEKLRAVQNGEKPIMLENDGQMDLQDWFEKRKGRDPFRRLQ